MDIDNEGAVIAGGKRRIDRDTSVPLIGAMTPSGSLDVDINPTGVAEIDIGSGAVGVSDIVVSAGQLLVTIQNLDAPKTMVTRLG